MAEAPVVTNGILRPRPTITTSEDTTLPRRIRSVLQSTDVPDFGTKSSGGVALTTSEENDVPKDAVERIAVDVSSAGLRPGTTAKGEGSNPYHTSARRFLVPDLQDNSRLFKFAL